MFWAPDTDRCCLWAHRRHCPVIWVVWERLNEDMTTSGSIPNSLSHARMCGCQALFICGVCANPWTCWPFLRGDGGNRAPRKEGDLRQGSTSTWAFSLEVSEPKVLGSGMGGGGGGGYQLQGCDCMTVSYQWSAAVKWGIEENKEGS